MLKRNKRIAQICAAAMCMSLFQGVGNGYIQTYADEKEDVLIAAEAVEDSEVTEGVSVSEEVESDDLAQESDEVSEDVQEVLDEENESIEENDIKQEDEVIENNNVTDNNEDTEITEESVESYDAAVSIDGLQYEIIDDTSVAVSKNTSFSTGEIVIPKKVEIEGKKYIVTSIKGFAFSNSKCSKVVIPNTVTSIGSHAFYYINSDAVIEVGCNRVKGLILNSSSEVRENQIKVISNDQTGDEESLESLNYTIIDGTSVSVSGLDFNNTKLVIPEKVTLEGKEYNVTEIDSNGFLGNATIKEVIIPGSVKKIGKNAFNGCSELYKVILKDGVETIESGAFVNDDIIKVMIPQSLVNIEQNSFEEFTSYTNFVVTLEEQKNIITNSGVYDPNVTVSAEQSDNNWVWDNKLEIYKYYDGETKSYYLIDGDGAKLIDWENINNYIENQELILPRTVCIDDKECELISIGQGALCYCQGGVFSKIVLPDTVKYLDDNALDIMYSGEIEIVLPDSIVEMGCGQIAFSGAKSINIPNKLESIGYSSFNSIANEVLVLPQTLKSIGYHSFKDLPNIEEVKIPYGVQDIGVYSFSGCSNLKHVELPSSLSNIGWGVFDGANKECTFTVGSETVKTMLINIGIDENKITVVEDNIGGTNVNVWDENNRFKCNGFTYRKLGDSTVEIYSYDKKNNKVDILNKIFIGDKEYTITRIGDFAFANNTDIERLYISNNIKSIGESAFNGCSNLTSFDKWETNLNSIGNCAFAGCSKLENNLSAKEIGEFAYKDCVSLKNIYLYNDVENIGNGAFWYCINADKVTIDSEDVNIGSGSFFSMSNSTFHVKNENVKQALIDSGVAESQIVIG